MEPYLTFVIFLIGTICIYHHGPDYLFLYLFSNIRKHNLWKCWVQQMNKQIYQNEQSNRICQFSTTYNLIKVFSGWQFRKHLAGPFEVIYYFSKEWELFSTSSRRRNRINRYYKDILLCITKSFQIIFTFKINMTSKTISQS